MNTLCQALTFAAALTAFLAAQSAPVWQPAREPSQDWAAMAYDVARERVVMFGGWDFADDRRYKAQTWEWNGTAWAQRTPVTSPSPRIDHAMAYDVSRARVVLFGGVEKTGRTADTWEWDGDTWHKRAPVTSPTAVRDPALAYDVARKRTVLFGNGETWEWDGTNWQKRTPKSSPGQREADAMAYDLVRQRVVLFGGIPPTTWSPLGDTWEWDGSDWTRRTPKTSPDARSHHAMAHDPFRGRVVLVGGYDYGTGQSKAGTWEWDGSDWTKRPSSTNAPDRSGHLVAFDIVRQRLVLFGGSARTDTWVWEGVRGTWSQRAPDAVPGSRWAHAMAYDATRREVVMFGGGDNRRADTWVRDGSRWIPRSPTLSPSGRNHHAMAYDAARQRTVLFGGRDKAFNALGDTWEWDGKNWTRLSPTRSPAPRSDHAMAYDAARQRTVLFGGWDRTEFADTWEWDGKNWTLRTPSASPRRSSHHAMAYDSARRRVVLVLGAGSPAETWEWDGTTWSKSPTTTTPGGRLLPAMAYDAARQRTVLFGGYFGVFNKIWFFGDTWEWDGTRWSKITLSQNPRARGGHAMAYDAARQRIVMFGGLNGPHDTWLFGPSRSATATRLGAACKAGGAAPVLTSGEPYLGNPDFRLVLLSGRQNTPCVFGLAGSQDNVRFAGGCTLYLKNTFDLFFAITNQFGVAARPVSKIPNNAALRGLTVYSQAFAVDAGSPALGLAFSAGRRLMVGD